MAKSRLRTSKLQHAKARQAKRIFSHFYNNKTFFPHIRQDYVKRMVVAGNVVYQDGIIIVYKKYKRKNKVGSARKVAQAGDVMLHQILNIKPGSGKASKILQAFFRMVDAPVWLTVRKANPVAVRFYLKNGMKQVGKISWMSGAMPGLVFYYAP